MMTGSSPCRGHDTVGLLGWAVSCNATPQRSTRRRLMINFSRTGGTLRRLDTELDCRRGTLMPALEAKIWIGDKKLKLEASERNERQTKNIALQKGMFLRRTALRRVEIRGSSSRVQ